MAPPNKWKICCAKVPADEVMFFCQILIAYVVILVSLINISLENGDICLWSTLASGTIGYLLPNPSLKSVKNEPILSDSAVECVDGMLSA
jgi:hypothetical protein